MKCNQEPVLWITSAVGCLSWDRMYEINRQISRGKAQSLSPLQCPWKIKAFTGREGGWSFPAGLQTPDIDLTNSGWEWNWFLGSMVKLSSWLDGGSKELHGVIIQMCIHSSAASSASPGPLLRLPPTCGFHTPHQGAQPWALPLQICHVYWAHQWYSPLTTTEFLGCLNCVHQLFKVRHGTYLMDGCWRTVSNTICLPDRLFLGYQVVHVFAEKHPKRGSGCGKYVWRSLWAEPPQGGYEAALTSAEQQSRSFTNAQEQCHIPTRFLCGTVFQIHIWAVEGLWLVFWKPNSKRILFWGWEPVSSEFWVSCQGAPMMPLVVSVCCQPHPLSPLCTVHGSHSHMNRDFLQRSQIVYPHWCILVCP